MKRTGSRVAIAALAAMLALAAGGSGVRAEEPPDGLVFDAMSAPGTVSFTGTVEVVHIGRYGAQASVYRIEHRAPGLTERSYTAPPNLAGDVVIVRGNTSYEVDAHRHRILRTLNDAANDQIAIDDNYILLRQNYRAQERGGEQFDGRPVVLLAMINNYTHKTTMLVRVDRATKLVLDKQLFAADGSLLAETRFEEVRYTNDIPDGDFAIPKAYAVMEGPPTGVPSPDVNRTVQTAGFPAKAPTFLPEGFSPVEAHVVDLKGVHILHLLYSDGLRTVSLFENAGASSLDMDRMHPQPVAIAGRQATYAEQGATTLLHWSANGLHMTLVGDLPLDELERIAASVTP